MRYREQDTKGHNYWKFLAYHLRHAKKIINVTACVRETKGGWVILAQTLYIIPLQLLFQTFAFKRNVATPVRQKFRPENLKN